MGGTHGQKHNPYLEGRYAHVNKNDVVFTPSAICKKICSMFPIAGKVLEPCKGEGAFLEHLPEGTMWCEIVDGVNFYDFTEQVDWIVTNPPYSDFNRFLEHAFSLAANVVLIVPFSKMFKSMGTLNTIFDYGKIVSIHYVGAGRCGFPFGFPCAVFHIKRGYAGETFIGKLDEVPDAA